MSYIKRGANSHNGNTLNDWVSLGGLLGILLTLTVFPIAGCSQLTGQSSSDETTASAETTSVEAGSSMKLHGNVASDSLASDAKVANLQAPPKAQASATGANPAAAVPAREIPPVTLP